MTDFSRVADLFVRFSFTRLVTRFPAFRDAEPLPGTPGVSVAPSWGAHGCVGSSPCRQPGALFAPSLAARRAGARGPCGVRPVTFALGRPGVPLLPRLRGAAWGSRGMAWGWGPTEPAGVGPADRRCLPQFWPPRCSTRRARCPSSPRPRCSAPEPTTLRWCGTRGCCPACSRAARAARPRAAPRPPWT